MKKILMILFTSILVLGLNACDDKGESEEEVIQETQQVITGEGVIDIVPTSNITTPTPTITPVVTLVEVVTVEEAIVIEEPKEEIVEPVEPTVEGQVIVDKCPSVPPVEEIQEFIPFTYPLPAETAWIAADYQAVADQEVIYKCDYRVHEGEIYRSLRNYNAYPDEFNTNGNPFSIVNAEFYTGASYLRPKSNEPTCTEKVVFDSAEDINHKSYAYRGWYSMYVHQTEGCSGYGTLEPYYRIGQFATALYGISAYGWTFAIDGVRYGRTQREYQTIPTPNSKEDLNFWELIKDEK